MKRSISLLALLTLCSISAALGQGATEDWTANLKNKAGGGHVVEPTKGLSETDDTVAGPAGNTLLITCLDGLNCALVTATIAPEPEGAVQPISQPVTSTGSSCRIEIKPFTFKKV